MWSCFRGKCINVQLETGNKEHIKERLTSIHPPPRHPDSHSITSSRFLLCSSRLLDGFVSWQLNFFGALLAETSSGQFILKKPLENEFMILQLGIDKSTIFTRTCQVLTCLQISRITLLSMFILSGISVGCSHSSTLTLIENKNSRKLLELVYQ